MFQLLFNLLLIYLAVMFVFVALTSLVAYMGARWQFAQPGFKTTISAYYPSGAFSTFWKEWYATCVAYLVFPFGFSDNDQQGNIGKTDVLPPVLFIHGWTENRRHWHWLIQQLATEPGRKLYTINLKPIDAKLDRYREQLAMKIDEILMLSPHSRMTLVGHSLGGIVARSYIKEHGSEKVERLITLGSPHKGTILAYAGPGKVPRHLEPGCQFLADLENDEHLEGIDLHSMISVHDNMVVPFTNGFLPGSTEHLLTNMGHIGMLRSPEVFRILHTILFADQLQEKENMDDNKAAVG